MTWVRIDDGFYDNPTNRALGAAGRDLFVASLTYCAKGLTDGRLPKSDLALVLATAQAKPAAVKKLVDAGRWIDHGDCFEVAEYLTYNPSKAKVLSDREWARQRRDLHSQPDLVQAIRARDAGLCRYCGVCVNWTDRRGQSGGTYDHVEPRGENTLENVVVACRGCNARKGDRTPDAAGMPLLAPGTELDPELDREQEETWPPSRPVPPTTENPSGSREVELAATGPIEQVFTAWKQSTGRQRAVLDAKRRRVITAALNAYQPDELVDAVRGWRHSPHHRGENDRHTVYNDLELLLRDAARIEKFRDLERNGGTEAGLPVTKSAGTLAAWAQATS